MIETLKSLALAGGHDLGAYQERSLENPRVPLGNVWQHLGYDGETFAGVSIGPESALSLSTVFRCISIISDGLADTPLHTFASLGDGRKEKARNHYAWPLLTKRANPDMTARRWKKLMGVWLLGWGNAFSKMEISPNGRVTALWPIHPARVQWRPEYDAYVVQGNDNLTLVPKDEMLHLRDIETDDSNMGKSRIRLARETLGLSSAQEKFGASFFGQGAAMSGFFVFPEMMSDDAKKNMRDYIKHEYTGSKNWRKMGILDGGMKFEKLQVDPVDAQFLESRQFSILEICRWFGVPPHMVAEMQGAKYNNLGDQEISFQRHTMRPYFGIMASEINNSLFSVRESATHYVEFEVNAILQMSPKEQAEVLNVARQNGIINADEWRSFINMNPIGGIEGESYIHNSNMVQTGAQIAAPKTNEKAID